MLIVIMQLFLGYGIVRTLYPSSKEEDAQVKTALIESRFIAGDLTEKPLNSVPIADKLHPNTCEQSALSSDTDGGHAIEDDAQDNPSGAEEDTAGILPSFMN